MTELSVKTNFLRISSDICHRSAKGNCQTNFQSVNLAYYLESIKKTYLFLITTAFRWCDLFIGVIYLRIMLFFALNRIFFLANEEALLNKQLNCLFKETNRTAGKWKKAFTTFYKPAHYKTFQEIKKSCIWATEFYDFKMDVIYKVVIRLRVVQFYSEIILVISQSLR